MKKLRQKILAVCVALLLAVGSLASVSEAKISGYYFKNKGISVTMDSAAKSFIEKAGKAQKTKVKKSCAYKGKDRTYQYKNFILYTYSNSESGPEYVQGISFRNSSISTAEGVKIGSDASLVTETYGDAEDNFGIYTYVKGNTKLQFEVTDGKVSKIRYTANKVK